MPIPVIGLHNEDKVFVNGSCVLNEERFMLIGSFVAFFIPLVIMVVTYCLTIQVTVSTAGGGGALFYQYLPLSELLQVFSSSTGSPEAGHCLPVRGKDFLPAAFAPPSTDQHAAAPQRLLLRPSDQHYRPLRSPR